MTARRWIEYTVAVLLGNGLYFFLLFPGLRVGLRHRPMEIDAGLLLDFACCVAVYGAIRLGSA